jgi:succinate dehydrogenase/fumarate reductase flavoprotein subunit
VLDDAALEDPGVAERVARASTRTEPSELPFEAPSGATVAVRVKPGITHTIGGLRVDELGRVADGLYAAGADVGGISTGGYASGLAAALVFGRIAAESALKGL